VRIAGVPRVGRRHQSLSNRKPLMMTTLETDSVIGSAVLKDQFGVFTKKKFKRGEARTL
jgi:hypothetical protein